MMMNPSPTHASAPLTPSQRRLRGALWTTQVLLAVAFFFVGIMKVTARLDQLSLSMPWVAALPPEVVRLIGVAEVLAALGLVLPASLRVRPWLTGYAAIGVTFIMALATMFHVARAEYANLPATLVLGALALFVAWGRLVKAPIAPQPMMHV